MDITKIDKNFDTSFTAPEDLEWHSVRSLPFSLHGGFYSEEEGLYRRIPKDIADATSHSVSVLSSETAGLRVRFTTDSPYIALRIEEPFGEPFSHMTIEGKCGASIYADGTFLGAVFPSYRQIANADPAYGGSGVFTFDGIKHTSHGSPYLAEVLFPLYSSVHELWVGLKRGARVTAAPAYRHTRPILFYGSSITQGGCASKPGDDYENRLCRMLDTDYINLGFSGSAKAEACMARYIAAQDPSVFVLDYDHNAPNAEHLKKTHYALYKTVRESHPDTPIVMLTMPTVEGYETRPWNASRREQIFDTLHRAQQEGDENFYLLDAYGILGAAIYGECGTVDNCHPDSLGFLRMAELLYPLLNKLLNGD